MALKSSYHDAPMELSSVLIVDTNFNWTREERILAVTGIDLPIGTVLAQNDDGDLVPYLSTPDDSQAVAVLITPCAASAEKQTCATVERGVRVFAPNLFWLPAVTDEQKAAALQQLEAATTAIQE